MSREANNVSEISTSTGTGSMTLAGAVVGYRTWNAGFGSSNVSVHYGIKHNTNGTWEDGIGTFLPGSNALQRDLVLSSSSGGSKVAFASGDKIVYCQHPAEVPQRVQMRRSSDIGIEIIPAASQSAAMIRVQAAGGGDAFTVSPAGKITSAGGIYLGVGVASGPTDLSRHVELYPSFGFSITSGRLNYNVPSATAHDFYTGGTKRATISASGLDATLTHSQDGGYFRIGAFSTASYGTGNARFWYNATGRRLSVHSDKSGSLDAIAILLGDLNLNADRSGTKSAGRVASAAGVDLVLQTGDANVRFANSDGALTARVDAAGTSSPATTTIITREKADARYQLAVSSAELKEDIQPLGQADTTGIMPRSWIWRMDGHPRNGLRGAGFVYEEIEAAFPEATYPAGPGRPGGLDTNALLAVFVGATRQELAAIIARIEALEAA